MEKYPKIQTLYERFTSGPAKNRINKAQLTRPEFSLINGWHVTEKIDGTNIRIEYASEHRVMFGGRGDGAMIPASLVNELAYEFGTERFSRYKMPVGTVLYGEGYGPGIQKGGDYGNTLPGFILFDVNVNGFWLDRVDVKDVARRMMIKTVPELYEGNLMTVGEIINLVEPGFTTQVQGASPTKGAEGIVARSPVELTNKLGERVMWKLKTRDFQKGGK